MYCWVFTQTMTISQRKMYYRAVVSQSSSTCAIPKCTEPIERIIYDLETIDNKPVTQIFHKAAGIEHFQVRIGQDFCCLTGPYAHFSTI